MYISARPLEAASNAPKAGTNSPAEYTLIFKPPSVASLILLAILSGEVPSPGKFFGQVVTIFSLRIFFEIAGVGIVLANKILDPPPKRKSRLPNFLVFFVILYPKFLL